MPAVLVATFNLNQRTIHSPFYWLFSSYGYSDGSLTDHCAPELVVLGFQEAAPFPLSLINAAASLNMHYIRQAQLALRLTFYQEYECITQVNLVGLCLFVFKKSNGEYTISNVATASAGAGFAWLGNKGALAASVTLVHNATFESLRICFVNCHLASGEGNAHYRNCQLRNILLRLVFPKSFPLSALAEVARAPFGATEKELRDYNSVYEHDFVFILGDLNYRLDYPVPHRLRHGVEALAQEIQSGNYHDLRKLDQLSAIMQKEALNSEGIFGEFCEAEIKFAPTYKLKNGTNDYAWEKRVPAWCDRILYWTPLLGKKGAQLVQNLAYCSSKRIRDSDHTPVSAMFKCTPHLNHGKSRSVAVDKFWAHKLLLGRILDISVGSLWWLLGTRYGLLTLGCLTFTSWLLVVWW